MLCWYAWQTFYSIDFLVDFFGPPCVRYYSLNRCETELLFPPLLFSSFISIEIETWGTYHISIHYTHMTQMNSLCALAHRKTFSLCCTFGKFCVHIWDTQRETENTKCIHTWNQESRKVVISFVQRKFILCFFSVINGKSKKKREEEEKRRKKKNQINPERIELIFIVGLLCTMADLRASSKVANLNRSKFPSG